MMEMMKNPIKLTRVATKKIARAARMAMDMFLYSAYVPHLDHKSLVNVPEGKLPRFYGTNFAKRKHMMNTYLIGIHPELWEIVRSGMEELQDPSSLTPFEY